MNENDMCCAYADPNGILLAKLQEMLERAEGEDKCVICNAIETLRAPKSGGFDYMWLMMLVMLMSPKLDSDMLESMTTILKSSMAKENSNGSDDTEP